jgi:hypothetical protein
MRSPPYNKRLTGCRCQNGNAMPAPRESFTVQYWLAPHEKWMDALKTDKRWKAEKRAGAIEREGRKVRIVQNPESAFERCVKEVASRGTAYDPRAVCATAGRRKYDQAEMTRRSVAGRKRAARRRGANPRGKAGSSVPRPVIGGRKFRGSPDYAAQVDRLNEQFEAAMRRGAVQRARDIWAKKERLLSKVSGEFHSNPAEAARAVSEEFHGRPVKEMIPVTERKHYHKFLAELGELRQFVVVTHDGRHKVKMNKFGGALLCANEEKNQLFVKGGDQSVNLRDFGIRHSHEVEDLGELRQVDYFTTKEHLGSEGGTAVYFHKFSRPFPSLHYHVRDSSLEISGGRYTITAEGIEN